MKSIVAVLVTVAFMGACTHYPSTIRFTAEAENRRLAQGKSDRVEGVIDHADALYVYVDNRGVEEKVERKDIGSMKHGAGTQMVRGGLAIGGGLILFVVSALYLECDQNEFPLACPFAHGKDNLWAAIGVVAGVAVTFWGVRALFSGMIDKSRVNRALEAGTASLDVAPMPIATTTGGVSPGVGLGLRF